MIALSIFIGLALFLLCVQFALERGRKRGRITLLEWAILCVGLVYGLGWALVIGFTNSGYNALWADRLLPFVSYSLLHNLLAFVLALCIILGWFMSNRPYRVGATLSTAYLSFKPDRLPQYAWILLIISIFLRWLYVQAYGGFLKYLEYSAGIRSAIFEVNNTWSFLQPFSGMAIFSSFLFFAALIEGRKRITTVVGFAISLIFSLYVLYSLLGRLGFLMFVSTIILSTVYMSKMKPRMVITGSLFGFGFMIMAAYAISELLDLKGANSIQEYVSRELSFPFVSFFAQLERGDHLYRWYTDFIFSPLYLLPSSWWMEWVEDASQINTLVVMGARKGDFGVTGTVPVDLITLGLMQFSVFGVVGVGIMYGTLLRFLQGFVDGIESNGLRAVLWSYLSIQVSMHAVVYASPHLVISGVFGILFSIFLIFIFSIFSKMRIA